MENKLPTFLKYDLEGYRGVGVKFTIKDTLNLKVGY